MCDLTLARIIAQYVRKANWLLLYTLCCVANINPLKKKRRLIYLKTQSLPRCKHYYLGFKNQSFYAVSGTSRSLFSDNHLKTKRIPLYLKTQSVPRCKHF